MAPQDRTDMLLVEWGQVCSENDGIDPALCSRSYTTVEMAAHLVMAPGKGTLLTKLDLESAYWMVPVQAVARHVDTDRWRRNGWLPRHGTKELPHCNAYVLLAPSCSPHNVVHSPSVKQAG